MRFAKRLFLLLILSSSLGRSRASTIPLTIGDVDIANLPNAKQSAPRKPLGRIASPLERLAHEEAELLLVVGEQWSDRLFREVHSIAEVVDFIPGASLQCVGDANDAERLERVNGVAKVAILEGRMKGGEGIQGITHAVAKGESEQEISQRGFALVQGGKAVPLYAHLARPLTPTGEREGKRLAAIAVKRIEEALGCGASNSSCSRVATVRSNRVVVEIMKSPSEAFKRAVERLKSMRFVQFVEPKKRVAVENRYARTIVQDGDDDISKTPLWDMGIQGKGQYVGSGDTGVDTSNCYLDGDKVAWYRSGLGDSKDDNGHGTHVSASLLGNSNDGKEDGVAKKAKLVFTDLQGGDSSGSELLLPENLKSGYYEPMREQGARITSDSWGSAYFSYSEMSQDVDFFAYEHQEALPVIAAGNMGAFESIQTPANAKNALTVGATLSPRSGDGAFNAAQDNADYFYDLSVTQGLEFLRKATVHRAEFGGDLTMAEADVAQISIASGCESVESDVSGKIAVASAAEATSSGCDSFEALAKIAEDAGAAAVLIALDTFACGTASIGESNDVSASVPTGVLPRKEGLHLLEPIQEGRTGVKAKIERRSMGGEKWERMLADFSSKGATPDLRIKPDIVAPGDAIASARAGSTCSTFTLSGTSMATPIIAGAATLAREFLQKRVELNGDALKEPSGHLVKAILMNGAQSMGGFARLRAAEEDVVFPMEEPPGCEQGMGMANLEQALAIGSGPKELTGVDGPVMEQTGQELRWCLSIEGAGEEVRVTMAWHDFPGSLVARVKQINDLRLTIRHVEDGWKWPERPRGGYDNVLKMVHPNPGKGKLQVNATANTLRTSQPFSLVATGPVSFVPLEECYDEDVSHLKQGNGFDKWPPFRRIDPKEERSIDQSGTNGFLALQPATLLLLGLILLLCVE